jgi:hypothetical protein
MVRPRAVRALESVVLAGGLVLGLPAFAQPAAGQPEISVNEFWPEANVYVKLGESSRLFLLASVTRGREYADFTEITYGIHYDWFAAELPQWWRHALPGMEQRWSLSFRFGYQRIDVLDRVAPDENRLLADATLRSVPLLWGLQVANRSRLEHRDIGSQSSTRYRNRTRLERSFAAPLLLGESLGRPLADLGVSSIVPYGTLEWFYDSRQSDWTRRSQQYGVEFELGPDRGLEFYVAIQDDIRRASSSVVAVGLTFAVRY